jgi:predicted transcriptional regulator
VGVVDRAAIVEAVAQPQIQTLAQLCAQRPLRYALADDNCRMVASRMAVEHVERLPVVKDAASLQLVGIIARSDLIKPAVIHVEEEEKRERLMGLPWQAEP